MAGWYGLQAMLDLEPFHIKDLKMSRFVVGYINFSDNEMLLKVVEASDWREAVVKHPNYPYAPQLPAGGDPGSPLETPEELSAKYSELQPEVAFRQCCFDCDCMMNWVQI